jgi:hypothetical protein
LAVTEEMVEQPSVSVSNMELLAHLKIPSTRSMAFPLLKVKLDIDGPLSIVWVILLAEPEIAIVFCDVVPVEVAMPEKPKVMVSASAKPVMPSSST